MDHVPDDVTARLDDALARVTDAIRRMPPGRLRSEGRLEAARALARTVATTVQGVEEADSATAPRWRELPDVPDLVVGDQLAVLAHDLQLAVGRGSRAEVWTPAGRATLADALTTLAEAVTQAGRVL